ncbi:hypothetical protein A0H81_08248 [Grifola frondosa]|uniref:Uncharacterized protein n=1 Tax=Grifola frondosa TaxID=5627 RepID=A0A1C7M4N2_GRIFR|nr:hypothetical protein A0H81_08248 [Grifola frondosa]
MSRRFRPRTSPTSLARRARGFGNWARRACARACECTGPHRIRKRRARKKAEADINKTLKECGSKGSVTWHVLEMGSLKDVDTLAKKHVRHDGRRAGETLRGQQPRALRVGATASPALAEDRHDCAADERAHRHAESEMHRLAPSITKFLSKEEINKDGDGSQLYGRTKLGLIYFARELVKRKLSNLPSGVGPILAISVHPGTVDTDMQKAWSRVMVYLARRWTSWPAL